MKKTVMLVVLDGWGYREETKDNAIAASRKPSFDRLWKTYPHSLLRASGSAVGLPEGQIGNSEVGHTTLGTGRPADTDLTRIDKAIASGEFEKNPVFKDLFEHAKKNNSIFHVQGLISPGGVHSHQNHLFALLRLAKKNGVPKVAIHAFTDGRDVPPQSASGYFKELEKVLGELNEGEPANAPRFYVATISGRYYAMDRDNNWDRLARAENAMFRGIGDICPARPSEYMIEQYKSDKKDELLEPTVCKLPEGTRGIIGKGDSVFSFNFRADRARMLSRKILDLPRGMDIAFATMTAYAAEFNCPAAFPPFKIGTTIGQEISDAGMTQARIAETEKFAHATYFLNGGREKPYENEKDILVPSRKDVKTHDLAPEMKAEEIADAAIAEIEMETNFIFINFANADMVGHTANISAIIEAIETTDHALGRVIEALEGKGGVALITADHGNAEVNIDPVTGEKHTAHTTSLVPCIVTDRNYSIKDGGLADVAPTILTLMNLKTPKVMTGRSLLVNE